MFELNAQFKMNIKYPIKKKITEREFVPSNLGMTLEKDLEETNLYYLNNNIAVIYKKPTPIQVVNVNYPARNRAKITEAYYKTPSTTDFNGIYKGKYIDFDAKETSSKTSMPLRNIHPHQIKHLKSVTEHGGIAFLIVNWRAYNKYFLLPVKILFDFWDNQNKKDGRKSIPYSVFQDECYEIPFGYIPRIDYLKVIQSVYQL